MTSSAYISSMLTATLIYQNQELFARGCLDPGVKMAATYFSLSGAAYWHLLLRQIPTR